MGWMRMTEHFFWEERLLFVGEGRKNASTLVRVIPHFISHKKTLTQ